MLAFTLVARSDLCSIPADARIFFEKLKLLLHISFPKSFLYILSKIFYIFYRLSFIISLSGFSDQRSFRKGPAEAQGVALLTGLSPYPTPGSKLMVSWILTATLTHLGEDLLVKMDNLFPLANPNLQADSVLLQTRLK